MSDTLEIDNDRMAAASRLSAGAKAKAGQAVRTLGAGAMIVGGAVVMYLATKAAAPPLPTAPKPVAATSRKLDMSELEPPRAMSMTLPPQPATPPASQLARKEELSTAEQMLLAMQRAPVTAYSKTVSVSPRTQTEERIVRDTEDKGAFERRFTPSTFEVAKAGMIGDRRFIITQGTSIPCVLETAMQSDQPGFVTCVITRDVLSFNGQVVLMEKGTQVFGEYRGGLSPGQARLNVIWSSATTPLGVRVQLGSAATDALGRAGVGGEVDTHWWERFSASFLLSVVNDISAIGTQRLQATQGVQASGTGQSGNQAAAIALEQTAAIKPTLKKHQGEMVNIMVARDLDFSGAYKLQAVKNTGAWSDNKLLEQPAGPLK